MLAKSQLFSLNFATMTPIPTTLEPTPPAFEWAPPIVRVTSGLLEEEKTPYVPSAMLQLEMLYSSLYYQPPRLLVLVHS